MGATALLLQVWSLKYLTVGDSSIFTFSSPIFVVVFATICLGEKCGLIPVGVAILTLFGIALIVRPPILTGQESFDVDNLVRYFCLIELYSWNLLIVLFSEWRRLGLSVDAP